MTIKELKEKYKGTYADSDVYYPTSFISKELFHTDSICYVDDYSESQEVCNYELMDKKKYTNTVSR